MECKSIRRHLARKLCIAYNRNFWKIESESEFEKELTYTELMKNWEENSLIYNSNFTMFLCCSLTEENAKNMFNILKNETCCDRHSNDFPDSIESNEYYDDYY